MSTMLYAYIIIHQQPEVKYILSAADYKLEQSSKQPIVYQQYI